MNSTNKITNLAAPTTNTDAATKQYVDDADNLTNSYGSTNDAEVSLPTSVKFNNKQVYAKYIEGTTQDEVSVGSGIAAIVEYGGYGVFTSSGNHHSAPWFVSGESLYAYVNTTDDTIRIVKGSNYSSYKMWFHYVKV